MANHEEEQPHVVMISVLSQGHVKPLLCLAELLSEAGLYVTFINTHHNHKRFSDLQALSTHFHNLHFDSISDGYPGDHPRSSFDFNYFSGINSSTKPHFKEFLLSYRKISDRAPFRPPVTCIIADGVLSFPIDVAEELGIPIFSFRANSARYLLEYIVISNLTQHAHGHDDDDHEQELSLDSMLGFELGCNDLPGFDMDNLDNHVVKFLVSECLAVSRATALILNTVDDLEASCFPHITPYVSRVYTVGPLHALLNSRIGNGSQSMASHGSLWNADQNCLTWLDSQPLRSVLYVSFGSIVQTSRSQMLEFLHGLVNSGQPFLWVVRKDAFLDHEETNGVIVEEIKMGIEEGRGCIVDWAPQEQVLAHKAVGGFLTHGGWNSLMESIVAGVPVICWPQFGDQFINKECIVKLWRIGVELDARDRSTIEKTLKTLMGSRREEFQNSVDRIAKCVEDSICEGGSSFNNIEMLVKDIKKIKI